MANQATEPARLFEEERTLVLKLLLECRPQATSLMAEYDGSGDSGGVERVWYEPPPEDGDEYNCPGISEPLYDAWIDLVEKLVDVQHSGYENNCGGCGTVVLNVATGRLFLDYCDRVEELNECPTEEF